MKSSLFRFLHPYLRLSLAVLLIGGLAFATGMGYCIKKSRALVTQLTDGNVIRIVNETFAYMENQVEVAEEGHLSLAWGTDRVGYPHLTGSNASEEDIFRFIEGALSRNPHSCGIGVGLLPSATSLRQGPYGFAAYVTTLSGKKERVRLGNLRDYTQMEWFAAPLQKDSPCWTHPYKDSSIGKVIVSFCIPIRSEGDSASIGVLCLDIDAERISRQCRDIIPFAHERISIVDDNFRFISHHDSTLLLQPTSADPHGLWAEYRQQADSTGQLKLESDDALCYFKRIPRTRWAICVECPKDEVYASIRSMERSTKLAAAISLFLLILCLAHILWKLQKVTRSKASLDEEIHIAAAIQKHMLPDTDAPNTNPRVDINGIIHPAKDIGGDLYDYFFHDGQLHFCIGDVSGKGFPASFFMAATRYLFRSTCATTDSPAEAVAAINNSLCTGNELSMFVTFFMGTLDLTTGRLLYCNAGHNPPVLIRTADGHPVCQAMEHPDGFPLGAIDDAPYTDGELTLQPGDALFLFTDGVTEAMNSHEEEFGDQRLMASLSNPKASSAADIVSNLRNDVNNHAGGAPQSDDITMLCIRLTENHP
ncbi:MAG: SpoIIE family protein phosphatase [Bacteroidaceae bacterium]|nr:SpoIIE family protein phosphatase [Bacteroidaceae bacterium]